MIDILISLSINTVQPSQPKTKREWQQHISKMCDQSQVGKIETAMDYFNRCFPIQIEYLEWLRKNDPSEYRRIEREQNEWVCKIIECKNSL